MASLQRSASALLPVLNPSGKDVGKIDSPAQQHVERKIPDLNSSISSFSSKRSRSASSSHWELPAPKQDRACSVKERMAAYDAQREKSVAKQNVQLRKLLKKHRQPDVPDMGLVTAQRMVAYDARRKSSAVELHAQLLRESQTSDYKIISLGCCCAVNLTLLSLSLRMEAYPFDNIRTSMEGVQHFLDTRFEHFLPYRCTDGRQRRVPYQGEFHSFWHDNLDSLEDHAKYKRRIDRFLSLADIEKKLFFVFACNTSSEAANGEILLNKLQSVFGGSKVWLLLLVDGQHKNRLVEIGSSQGRLLVHCIAWHDCEDQGSVFMDGVREGISCFIQHIEKPSALDVVQSCAMLEASLISYTGGDTRREKYKLRRCGQVLARATVSSGFGHRKAVGDSKDVQTTQFGGMLPHL